MPGVLILDRTVSLPLKCLLLKLTYFVRRLALSITTFKYFRFS